MNLMKMINNMPMTRLFFGFAIAVCIITSVTHCARKNFGRSVFFAGLGAVNIIAAMRYFIKKASDDDIDYIRKKQNTNIQNDKQDK